MAFNLMVSDDDVMWTNTLVRCTLAGECSRMVETVPVPDFEDRYATRYQLVRDVQG